MLNILKEVLSVGFQFWWPVDLKYHYDTGGDWRVEVIVGAILTQNTKWEIVEKSINKIKEHNLIFDIEEINNTSEEKLLELVKSVPFNLSKVKRIKTIVKHIIENFGSLDDFFSLETYELRKELLSIKGIGRETADVIILYSSEKPIFVVDNYTRKLLYDRGIIHRIGMDYDNIRIMFETFVKNNINELLNEFYSKLLNINCMDSLKKAFNYDSNIKIFPPLNVCDLTRDLYYENKLVIIYKELHAIIDTYMKRNKNKKTKNLQ